MDTTIAGIAMYAVCTDGQWVVDPNSIEDQFKCDEEGAKKDMDMGGLSMPMVCKDGQWVADMSGFDFSGIQLD